MFFKYPQKILSLFKVLFLGIFIFPIFVFASTTDGTILKVLPTDGYAWGKNVGWINLATAQGNIHITNTELSGYMWDSIYGWVNLKPTGTGVKNDGNGNLSGFAWSAGAGFIDFTGVTINSSGVFTGIANGVMYGQINFSCSTCNVVTDWRPVSQQAPLTNGAVGPISIFMKNNSVTIVSTTTEEEIPPVTNFEPIYNEEEYKPQPKSIPSNELENPVISQPIVNTVGIPVVSSTTGQKFVTKPTTQNVVQDSIISMVQKLFESVLNFIKNLPGSMFTKLFFVLIFILSLSLLFFLIKRYKEKEKNTEENTTPDIQ